MPIITEITEQSSTIIRPQSNKSTVEKPGIPILNGDWNQLPTALAQWAKEKIQMCQPSALHIMDGSIEEDKALKAQLVKAGVLIPLPKYEDCYYTRTDPKDVARVESKTVISTPRRIDTIPDTEGVQGTLGHWISPQDLDKKINLLLPGCMAGRTMYLIPYSMGPVGSPMSRIGVELTDSAYVAVSMRVMTRIGAPVISVLRSANSSEFVKCFHSVGQPLAPGEESVMWPCNPENTIIAHRPDTAEIISFGSGYGGNSLLGKKCFALRLGSTLARKQGWLAEHMLIMGVSRPGSTTKRYICAAFPSACGKTNLAMLMPKLEGYTTTCVGDDIAWLRFDSEGRLRAINPENGFFGVAPGTSEASNPMAMKTIFKNTLFTNVALTDDGGVWWEGMTSEAPAHLIDWKGQDWTPGCGRVAAHPNSRFCAPAANCPSIDPNWESPEGVPIDAILFGGRRPEGVPLVIESFNWEHGVFLGAALKSEATAAAEHKGKVVMHDPFSMRPFFGYNFGYYLQHWLSFGEKKSTLKLPRVFMVNWFRKNPATGKFVWPGFGDNIRVIDWVLRRCDGESNISQESPIGILPKKSALNIKGIENQVSLDLCFDVPKSFWKEEVAELGKYFRQQVGSSLPKEIKQQLDQLEKRLK